MTNSYNNSENLFNDEEPNIDENDLRQWQKDLIDSRLEMIAKYPERLRPIE